jgi:hypothetical protein
MRVDTACYRQEGSSRTSLLLQQVYDRKKDRDIVLACVCTEELPGARDKIPLCDILLDTFRQKILTENTENMNNCCKYISEVLPRESTQNTVFNPHSPTLSYSGMFANGDDILLFGSGKYKIYLINTLFLYPHLELISGTDSIIDTSIKNNFTKTYFNIFKIEPGAAVLAATAPFYEHMDEKRMKECMHITNDASETKLQKHLAEYGEYMESKGGADMGAVVLRMPVKRFV